DSRPCRIQRPPAWSSRREMKVMSGYAPVSSSRADRTALSRLALPVRKLAAEIFARAEDSCTGSVTRISPSRRSKRPRTGPRPNRCRVVNVMAERAASIRYVPGAGLLVLAGAVGVVACALLPVLLRWPVPGALALAALAAVSPAAIPAATVGTLHVAEWRRFAVAAAVGAAGVMAGAVQGLWRPVGGLPYIWWLVLVIVAEVALVGWGQLTRARHALIA